MTNLASLNQERSKRDRRSVVAQLQQDASDVAVIVADLERALDENATLHRDNERLSREVAELRIAVTGDQFLTPKEVAAELSCNGLRNISEGTLANWRNKKIGPEWVPLGGRPRYQRSAIRTWVASITVKSKEDHRRLTR